MKKSRSAKKNLPKEDAIFELLDGCRKWQPECKGIPTKPCRAYSGSQQKAMLDEPKGSFRALYPAGKF